MLFVDWRIEGGNDGIRIGLFVSGIRVVGGCTVDVSTTGQDWKLIGARQIRRHVAPDDRSQFGMELLGIGF